MSGIYYEKYVWFTKKYNFIKYRITYEILMIHGKNMILSKLDILLVNNKKIYKIGDII